MNGSGKKSRGAHAREAKGAAQRAETRSPSIAPATQPSLESETLPIGPAESEEIVLKVSAPNASEKSANGNLSDAPELIAIGREIADLKGLVQEILEEHEKLQKRVSTGEARWSRQEDAAQAKLQESQREKLQTKSEIAELQQTTRRLQEFAAAWQQSGQAHKSERMETKATPPVGAVLTEPAPRAPEQDRNSEKAQQGPALPQPNPVLPELPDDPGMYELKITTQGTSGINRVPHGEPFGIRVELDQTKRGGVAIRPYQCHTAVYAKRLDGSSPEIIVEKHQLVSPAEPVAIDAVARVFSPGLYRLQAAVTLAGGQGQLPRKSITKEGLLYVY